MVTIHLLEGKKRKSEVVCEPGSSLLTVLQEYEFISEAACGGKGICGACTVRFLKEAPLPTAAERAFFSPDMLRQGRRLACRVKVTKDIYLEMPEGARNPDVLFGRVYSDDLQERGTTPHSFLVVTDLGTTTIAMELRDSKSGRILAQYAALNPQRKYGADVISRMEAARESIRKKEELSGLVQREIGRGLEAFRKQFPGMSSRNTEVFLAGNTVMLHLLSGLSVEQLCRYPFTPVTLAFENMEIEGYKVTLLPGISAFVGADIVADLYALGMLPGLDVTHKVNNGKARLLADLGTNAELAYEDGETLTVTATAAGPAFEGGITAGIFGADLIRLTALLLEQGSLDENGLLQGEAFEKGIEVEGTLLHQEDIRLLQLAKAAVAAGIEVLAPAADTELYLAGGFGYYLDAASAAKIGLVPGICREKIQTTGNLVLQGIYLIATDLQKGKISRQMLEQVLQKVKVINLGENKDFQEKYIKHINF